MIKRYKTLLIITSIIILLPMVVGVILWNDLPDVMATHWGINNEPDGWSSKGVAVFGIPLLMLALHWASIFATAHDYANRSTNGKLVLLLLWIVPALSLMPTFLVYPAALGREVNADFLAPALVGILFIIIGNYLPKCRQSRTLGIKIKWTLENEENWNATHRFAGKIWVVGGILIFLSAFLPLEYSATVMLVALLLMVLVPTFYSYCYHRKQEAQK